MEKKPGAAQFRAFPYFLPHPLLKGLFIINSAIRQAENSRIDLLPHKYKDGYDQHCHT